MPVKGVEPLILTAAGLKPDVYSNSTTQAFSRLPRSRFRGSFDRLRIPVILVTSVRLELNITGLRGRRPYLLDEEANGNPDGTRTRDLLIDSQAR